MRKGLAPQTSELFDAVSRLDCIKPFVLVGGTALSLQLNARQSEDLDFPFMMLHLLISKNLSNRDWANDENYIFSMITKRVF